MLSTSSGVRISSKSEKSDSDKSSIVSFRDEDMIVKLGIESNAMSKLSD